jgi:hypothetical protein
MSAGVWWWIGWIGWIRWMWRRWWGWPSITLLPHHEAIDNCPGIIVQLNLLDGIKERQEDQYRGNKEAQQTERGGIIKPPRRANLNKRAACHRLNSDRERGRMHGHDLGLKYLPAVKGENLHMIAIAIEEPLQFCK